MCEKWNPRSWKGDLRKAIHLTQSSADQRLDGVTLKLHQPGRADSYLNSCQFTGKNTRMKETTTKSKRNSNSFSVFVTNSLLGHRLRREMEFIISCLKWQNAAKVNRSLTGSRRGCKHLFRERRRRSAAQRLLLRAATRSCCSRGRNLTTSILSWAAQCSRAYYRLAICLKWSDRGGNVVLPGSLKKKRVHWKTWSSTARVVAKWCVRPYFSSSN